MAVRSPPALFLAYDHPRSRDWILAQFHATSRKTPDSSNWQMARTAFGHWPLAVGFFSVFPCLCAGFLLLLLLLTFNFGNLSRLAVDSCSYGNFGNRSTITRLPNSDV